MVMMIFHAPASILLPLFGSTVMGFMRFIFPGMIDTLWPQTIFLLVVGVVQYFCLGYLIGMVVVWLRRRLGFAERESKSSPSMQPGRLKIWFYNLFYVFFTISILNMLMDVVMQYLTDPEFFKLNYPAVRHWLELGLIIVWLALGYALVRFNLAQKRNFNRGLLIAAVILLFIYPAIYLPKLSIKDIPEATGLEGLYARQQAEIFFDNPLERIIIMKTVIVGMDDNNYQVAAYTFFGLKYRLVDIEKVSEYEMRLLLDPGAQERQHKARAGAREILKRIKHPQWPRVEYSDLIKDSRFRPEKIQGIVPGISETNSLFLRTDYDEYEVYLLIYMEDAYTNALKKDFAFEDTGSRPEYIINTKEMRISKAYYTSVLDSYRIEFAGLPYYMIFDVVSDQEPPANLDHIWNPDHNIKEEDIRQILTSVAGGREAL
jgi:hypothetical protein